MIYLIVGAGAIVAMGSLAVDYGRVQLAKSELQTAATAAARYAVTGLRNRIDGHSAAAANARATLAESRVDCAAVQFDPSTDLALGIWNPNTRTFTATGNASTANAVRVTLDYVVGAGSIPLTLGSLVGRDRCTVRAESIALIDFSTYSSAGNGDGTFTYWVPATSNPWLAGMPAGTKANQGNPHNNPDYAGIEIVDDGVGMTKNWLRGNQGSSSSTSGGSSDSNYALWGQYATKKSSPIAAGGFTVTPGTTLSFANLNGGANNLSGSGTFFSADGNTGSIVSNYKGNENGKSDIVAPINCVIAVFLSDANPQSGPTPPTLDFSTAASRNFQVLAPQLKQVFFIGDGRRSNGEVQQFVIPPGATRMFIGTMDSYEWNNNVGGFEVTSIVVGRVSTVR